MTEIETLKQTLAERDAHIKGLEASLLKIQTDLDTQLQLHIDKDAAHAAALEDTEEAAKKDLSNYLAEVHAREVAELKSKFLEPAVRDLHARQAADLAAQHQATLDALHK